MSALTPISGHTRVFGIVADPVGHVQTPQRLNTMMAAQGIDSVTVPLHVSAPDLPVLVAGLRTWRNFGGFVATVPHKQAVIALCDEVSPRALAIGAANVVWRDADGRLVADMLDDDGFLEGLAAAGHAVAGRRAFLAGAGGAANAIAFALAEAGVGSLTLSNRTQGRAGAARPAGRRVSRPAPPKRRWSPKSSWSRRRRRFWWLHARSGAERIPAHRCFRASLRPWHASC